MDRIIEELLVRCVLGIDDEERREMWSVLVTVALHADLRRAGESDRLEDTVDYPAQERDPGAGRWLAAPAGRGTRGTDHVLENDLAKGQVIFVDCGQHLREAAP